MHRTLSLNIWLAAALLFPAAMRAQTLAGTGTISGMVRDASGAEVPDAEVQVDNAERGIRWNTRTNRNGVFSVVAVVPASGYSVVVSKAGFAPQERVGVEVAVGEDTGLAFILTIAPARTTLSVDESPPVVDHTKTGVSQVIRSSQIFNLPINGRRVDTHVLLTPAVVPDGVLGLVAFRGIAGGNAFLTDGNDTSNQFFHENAGRTRIPTQISQDAVQEFQVLSSGYSAAYGRASGGIINTITRSGSNSPSGTAYWFFRNRSMNARDPYSAVNPPERRHQAGASIGGKLVPDKLFYFFNVEVHRRNFPLVASLGRPPLYDATGRFVGTCSTPATPAQCAAAQQFLNRHFQVLDRRADTELAFGRLDWVPLRRHHLSASSNYLRFYSPDGLQTQAALNNGEGVGANGNSSVRTRYGRATWNFSPTTSTINELRFGWFKDRHSDQIDQALVPPETGLVQIAVAGQQNLGMSPELPRIDPSENRFELADSLHRISGRHGWKLGANAVHTRDFLRYLQNRNGSYVYADFNSFAQDFSQNTDAGRRWQHYSQRFGNEIYNQAINDYSFFAEDQFRAYSNVTINYGIRYEFATLPQPGQVNPEYPEFGKLRSAKRNLAPRMGIAVAFNQSRTVMRAGFGIFFARYHSGVIGTFFLENGTYQQSVHIERRFLADVRSGPVFPNVLPALATPPTPSDPNFNSSIDLTFPGNDYRNPYTEQGDIGLEHAFTPTFSAGASYLWSRGLHLTTVRDLNIGPPGAVVTYQINDAENRPVGDYTIPVYRLVNRVNPRWRRVNSVESGGNSYYNALVVQLKKRLSRGFEGFLSYTWSHAIDYNQGGGSDNLFFNDGPRSLWNGDYHADRASSQLDQRHRLILSSSYEPVVSRNAGRLAHLLLNHWRISQISTFASAQPDTPRVLISGVPFPGAAFNSTLNGFGGSARVPFLPASSLDIDQVVRTDARLARIVKLGERHELHLRFEAFNVFNHVSDTAVNTLAYEAANGILRPLERLGEGVASQGYPDGTNARRAQVSVRFIW